MRVRNAILRDGTRDTGCGLKAFRREVFLVMPYFDGLHRFLPALVRREGYEIAYVDVIDRPRHSGVSNYGFFDRLWIGIMDLAGVWWLIRRKKPTPVATEVTVMLIQFGQALGDYLYDVFVIKFDWLGRCSAWWRRCFSPCASWCSGSRPNARARAWCRWRSGSSRSAADLMPLVYGIVKREPVIILGPGAWRLSSTSAIIMLIIKITARSQTLDAESVVTP